MKLAAPLAFVLLGAGLALPAAPAAAQNQRIIDIFGDDRCPASQGSEIVVCVRHDEPDRYRIPQALRRSEPERRTTGVALAETAAGASRPSSGMDSCSPVGAAGQSGCFMQQARAARAAQKQAAAAAPDADQ